ncbi:prepilin-type N-terminal cleavage/methylation domain-containing protein [Vogesella fluminis]|uniref:Prepilin-type N-terminal cleavage/methylation domain-containing protein n=1 Tax=Vogesella fluminis TaxID=1069161 RepID=A0ABQ3HBN2_9NEIS|nr:prepilin-type N-terminal cleavage/methylation domain-containing protein [Vogesella fluminis]GHD76126.1 hypothetical protein GCM10011419_15000 [Vogesella fluminis]
MRLNTQRGMSLLELLVSMTIGLILLLALFNLMANLLATQSVDKRRALAGSVLDTAVSMMGMELRRAGYWGSTASGTNPYGNLYIENSGSCIRYAYAPLPGESAAASASRYLAFRLDNNKLQHLQTTAANWSCSAAANLWQDMSKADQASGLQLQFAALNAGKAIDIAVTARDPGNASQTFSRSTTVQLRNLPAVTTP